MPTLIVDTDPGIDDAHALCMALTDPGTSVLAVTAVAGNVELQRTTDNALYLLERMAADVPVFAGCERPLVEPRSDAAHVHGPDGLGGLARRAPMRRPQREHAATALVRLVLAASAPITLVALGPLTNLALATRLDPRLGERCERLVFLGGAVRATGNHTAVAEFNVGWDPEAAEIVLSAWPRITMVPWETVLETALTPGGYARTIADNGPAGTLLRAIVAGAGDVDGPDRVLAPDPLAMAVALDPGCVTSRTAAPVVVALAPGPARGQTVLDPAAQARPDIDVVTGIDRERALAAMTVGDPAPVAMQPGGMAAAAMPVADAVAPASGHERKR